MPRSCTAASGLSSYRYVSKGAEGVWVRVCGKFPGNVVIQAMRWVQERSGICILGFATDCAARNMLQHLSTLLPKENPPGTCREDCDERCDQSSLSTI